MRKIINNIQRILDSSEDEAVYQGMGKMTDRMRIRLLDSDEDEALYQGSDEWGSN